VSSAPEHAVALCILLAKAIGDRQLASVRNHTGEAPPVSWTFPEA
jgi:hypothetical protein